MRVGRLQQVETSPRGLLVFLFSFFSVVVGHSRWRAAHQNDGKEQSDSVVLDWAQGFDSDCFRCLDRCYCTRLQFHLVFWKPFSINWCCFESLHHVTLRNSFRYLQRHWGISGNFCQFLWDDFLLHFGDDEFTLIVFGKFILPYDATGNYQVILFCIQELQSGSW